MKGYAEDRGLAFLTAFDAVSGQFTSQFVPHPFVAREEPGVVVEKLRDWHERRKSRRLQALALRQLSVMTPEALDDVGMTDRYVGTRLR